MNPPTNVLSYAQSPVAPLRIFQNYINFLHFFFLCPFSVQYEEKRQIFIAATKKWRQRVVSIIYVVSLCFVVRMGFIDVQIEIARNPSSGFEQWTAGVTNITWWSFLASAVATFTFNKDTIIGFLNQFQVVILGSGLGRIEEHNDGATNKEEISSQFSSRTFIFNQKRAKILTPCLPLCVIISALQDYHVLMQRMGGTSISAHDFELKKSQMFFTDRAYMIFTGRVNSTDSKETLSVCDYGVTVSYLLLSFVANVVTQAGYTLSICVSFCTWIIVRTWAKYIKSIPPSYTAFKRVLDNLEEMFLVLDFSEQAFGLLLCATFLGLIPLYAIQLPELFVGGLALKVEQLLQKLSFISIVFLTANVNCIISSIQTWIQYSYSKLRKDDYDEGVNCRVIMMFQKLNSRSVGVSGKLFMITYGFMGNALSAIVTYAIIMIQLKNNN